MEIRSRKSMVIRDGDPNSKSAGSFFKNPVISQAKFESLKRSNDVEIPSFSAGDNVKVPAAWLIEHAGFGKGFSLGNAGLSSKHTLAVINRSSASASDVVALRDLIQAGVKERFGITLETEPIFVGFRAS